MKRVLIILIAIITILSMPLRVLAADEEYKTFIQGDERWGSYVYGGGNTIRSTGCMITGIAILMAYANEDLRDVNTWNPQIAATKFSFAGGAIYWGSTTNADPTFSLVGGGKQYQGGNLSVEEGKSRVMELLDKGYYVLICTKGLYTPGTTHYSPIVGVEGGNPVVWDVAGGNKGWDEWAGTGLTEILAYESSIKPSTETLGNKASSVVEEPMPEEKQQAAESLIKEWELVGMPEEAKKLLENQNAIYPPSRDELSITDNIRVSQIKDNIKNGKITISESFNTFLFFVGLGCMAYAILLLLALMLDYTNTFIEFSLLKLITFGKYRLVSKEYFEENKLVGYDKKLRYTNVTPGMCLVRIVVLVSLGVLITSGVVQYLIVYLINKIKGTI